MIIHEIDEAKFNEYTKEGVVLVDFFATWCGPCKMLAPELEEVSKEVELKIVKVDIDKYQRLAGMQNIMSVPTLLLYNNGKLVSSKVGYMPKDLLLNWIKESTK